MTPRFWHIVAVKLKPFRRKLVFGAAIGLTGVVVGFSFLLRNVNGQKLVTLLPPLLLLSAIVMFWSLGLLQLISRCGVLPVKSSGPLGSANYCWNVGASWFGAWFFTLWFLLLVAITAAAPFILLHSIGR